MWDCARPPFALEHLQQRDPEHLVYHSPKARPDAPGDLVLTRRRDRATPPPHCGTLSVGNAAGREIND